MELDDDVSGLDERSDRFEFEGNGSVGLQRTTGFSEMDYDGETDQTLETLGEESGQ